jgi:hypothetical protein
VADKNPESEAWYKAKVLRKDEASPRVQVPLPRFSARRCSWSSALTGSCLFHRSTSPAGPRNTTSGSTSIQIGCACCRCARPCGLGVTWEDTAPCSRRLDSAHLC